VRYENRYGFRMSSHVRSLARSCVEMGLVGDLSGARVRDELVAMLEEPRVAHSLARLCELGLAQAVHPALDCGRGPAALVERLEELRAAHAPELPRWRVRLAVLARRLLAEARRRTTAWVSLPDEDAVEVAVVRGRPWSASCTYLGGYRSRIELGADEPPTFARLLDLVCHEGYPGHHAERVRRELQGRPECRPVLAVGPSAVLSEGLASHAAALVFDEDDLRALAREAGLSPEEAEEEVVEWRAAAILSRLRAVNSNAVLLPPAERADYLVRYGLRSPERAERIAAWMADPLHAAYTFAYPAGLSLVESLVARHGREKTLRLLLS
jgi:hypothetical protein